MHSPVLSIIFNRPDTTQKVFDVLREVKPPRLFVCAEGPRKGNLNDVLLCKKAREVYDHIDWDCEVHRLYRDSNSGGCGLGVSKAINWFFEHVDKGVILEDDILPHPDFFKFCDEMLEKYSNDTIVKCICGSNVFYDTIKDYPYSYYFSHYMHVWGWATWKRSWNEYNYSLRSIPKDSFIKNIKKLPIKKGSKRMAFYIYDKMTSDKPIDTWDYQLTLSIMYKHGVNIIPITNLCHNIGFGREDATHTKGKNINVMNHVGRSIYPVNHPPQIKTTRKLDDITFSYFSMGNSKWYMLKRMVYCLLHLLHRI